ncbi:MAG: hypothetical protein HC904_13350 [Blastochloris sp.]|nr:hypothetical protein [Blastochloris sp.]
MSSITASGGGEVLRLLQSGNLQAYVVLFILGVLLLCYWVLVRGAI